MSKKSDKNNKSIPSFDPYSFENCELSNKYIEGFDKDYNCKGNKTRKKRKSKSRSRSRSKSRSRSRSKSRSRSRSRSLSKHLKTKSKNNKYTRKYSIKSLPNKSDLVNFNRYELNEIEIENANKELKRNSPKGIKQDKSYGNKP